MGLIKLNEDKEVEATPKGEEIIIRKIDVREALPDDNSEIIELLLSMLNHLNLDYIRMSKGVIEYRHYPSVKSEE